jgi:pyruvate kinase
MEILVTLDPYAPFIEEIVRKPSVKGIRFNTALPLKEPLDQLLTRLRSKIYPKDLWVDLKCRQLRVTNNPTVPQDLVELNHKIKVKTPAELWYKELVHYNDGRTEEVYRLLEVEKVLGWDFFRGGNKIKLKTPPGLKVKFGQGAAVSIIDPTLKVHGYLTKRDKEFIEAAKKVGIHKYMISFAEKESDVTDVLSKDSEAIILAKIESEKGLDFVDKVYPKYKDKVQLMTARGDLYMWLDKPHKILNATEKIIKADPNAVVASRIFQSLSRIKDYQPPACEDICDVGYLLKLGYKRFLFGDEICYNRDKLLMAIGLLEAIVKDYI